MEILTDHVVYMTTEGKAKEVKEYLQARFYKLLLLFKFELDYIEVDWCGDNKWSVVLKKSDEYVSAIFELKKLCNAMRLVMDINIDKLLNSSESYVPNYTYP